MRILYFAAISCGGMVEAHGDLGGFVAAGE